MVYGGLGRIILSVELGVNQPRHRERWFGRFSQFRVKSEGKGKYPFQRHSVTSPRSTCSGGLRMKFKSNVLFGDFIGLNQHIVLN